MLEVAVIRVVKHLLGRLPVALARRVIHRLSLVAAAARRGIHAHDEQFYTVKLDAKGQPMLDQHGIALIDCSRGTNDTECVHKQIVTTFGSWNTGVELGDMRSWNTGVELGDMRLRLTRQEQCRAAR